MKQFQLDFMGIGTIKSGSSLLADLLMQHPEVQWASRKELNYFNAYQADGSINPYQEQPFSFYRQFFPENKSRGLKWGEYSPVYMADKVAMHKIQSHFPSIGIIVSLRNPVDRAYSHYLYARDFLQTIPTSLEFEEAYYEFSWLKSLGMYSSQLELLFSLFPRDQCLVFIFEELIQHPLKFAGELYRHIGVDDNFQPEIKKVNANKQIKYQPIENLLASISRLKANAGKRTLDNLYNSPLYPMILELKHRIRDLNIKSGEKSHLPITTYQEIYTEFQADIELTRKLLNIDEVLWPIS